jgi:hypothetical protein
VTTGPAPEGQTAPGVFRQDSLALRTEVIVKRVGELIVKKLGELMSMLRSSIEAARIAYQTGTRHFRMRVWIASALGIDVIATLVLVAAMRSRPIDIDVWFRQSFPSNVLVLRNEEGKTFRNAVLILDQRYRLEVEELPPGLSGFQLADDFDDYGERPPETYQPSKLELVIDGDRYVLPVLKDR